MIEEEDLEMWGLINEATINFCKQADDLNFPEQLQMLLSAF